MTELQRRVISAAFLLPIGVAVVWLGGPVFVVFLSLVAAGSTQEWLRLAIPSHDKRLGTLSSLLAGLSIAGLALQTDIPTEYQHLPVMLPVIAILAAWLSARGGQKGYPIAVFGICYVLLAVLGVALIRAGEDGLTAILYVVAVVVATDIGAYFVGRAIGGPKLAPKISPGKTWSGAIGGILAAELALIGLNTALGEASLDMWSLGLGVLLSIASQLGDLGESALKRRAGVKDSGRLIPGHGGLLDRFDGFLAAALALFLLRLSGMPTFGGG